MSVASQAVDPKTAQRLRARRIVVVDADAARAHAFAEALQQCGAAVAAISPADTNYDAAHALDADVLLVNEDEAEACRAVVLALRQNPRTRWSTVLPVSFAALRPSDADQPDVATIADQVTGFATALVELTVRAKGKLPYYAPLEPLGPSRILRALGSTDRSLRIVLSDARMHVELELAAGIVGGVRGWLTAVQTPLCDAEALSEALAMPSGELHIEELGELTLKSWNVELTAALASAAAITQERSHHATVPQLSFADILAEAKANGRVPVGFRASDPRSRSEPAPIPSHAPEPTPAAVSDEPCPLPAVDRHARTAQPKSSHARPLAMGFALLGACALALALAVRSEGHDTTREGSLSAAAYGGSLAASIARAEPPPPSALAAAPPQPAEPQAAIAPPPATLAQAAAAPRGLSRAELDRVKGLVKRAHRYARDKRYATAALAYSKALALDSTHVVALRALVRIHLRERNAEEALRWAQRLSELEPDNGLSQLLLGDAYALSGDTTLAEQSWRRASALGNDAAGKRAPKTSSSAAR